MMVEQAAKILVIDDDPDVLMAAKLLLKRHYPQVVTDSEPEHLPGYLERQDWDLVLLDMNFAIGASSGQEGLHWLARIREQRPGTPVVLMTAYGAVETAVQALKQGAADFVLKPWQNDRLLATLAAALRLHGKGASAPAGRPVPSAEARSPGDGNAASGSAMIGESPALRELHRLIAQVAPTDANLLILGENGSGKEVAAREIHRLSARAAAPFVSVDLGAVPESLFESEMFGHRKGAFTGATQDRAGRIQAASGGTLFLDEIGNLPLALQSKLLNVLEQRQVMPLGSDRPVPVDIRLLCATNQPLRQLAREGSFREDLLYRINTVELLLPPLRERREDLPLLLSHFLAHYAQQYGLAPCRLSPEALTAAQAYRWPGNIRELRHAVERGVILCRGDTLGVEDLLLAADPAAQTSADILNGLEDLNLEGVEKAAIEKALRKHAGNISHAARELGITRTSLYRRMEKYGL